MVFTLNKENNSISAAVENEDKTEQYKCEYTVCENPVCTCGNLTLVLIPTQDASNEQKLVRHSVEIDVGARALDYGDMSKVSKKDFQYANLLFNQLDEKDFEMLYRLHYSAKCHATEEALAQSIKASFDYNEIENEGLTCAYNDILPYGIQLPVIMDEKEYLLLDQYCLRSTCPCTDANIVLLDRINGKTKEMCVVLVEYRKKTWEMFERLSSAVTLAAVKSAAENKYPDIYNLLQKRHRRLREIYAHCKRANYSHKEESQALKVGRNEPCPCGSGKKFKRCCGRR